MTSTQIMKQLEKLGNEQQKKTYLRHGAREPIFGVMIRDLKPIQKKLKKNYELALELFDTGNADAMYLAGLIADETKMTKRDLNKWARDANWHMISEYSVAWVAAESKPGLELGLKWIDSWQEKIQTTGWATLSSYVAVVPDDEIDIKLFKSLIDRVAKEIHKAPSRVRYGMNDFVIAAGCYVAPLKDHALAAARKIGKVEVEMASKGCKVPPAEDYIKKVEKMGRIGKKRKTARC